MEARFASGLPVASAAARLASASGVRGGVGAAGVGASAASAAAEAISGRSAVSVVRGAARGRRPCDASSAAPLEPGSVALVLAALVLAAPVDEAGVGQPRVA